MATISNVQWNAVTGAVGYRIHAGPSPGLYTHVADVGNNLSGSITVPNTGVWYVAVAAYDVNGYEGFYSAEIARQASDGGVAPAPRMAVRSYSVVRYV